MTETEARIFIGSASEEEDQDAYELALFEFASYFTNRTIIWDTFQARRKKLKNFVDAAKIIGLEDEIELKNQIGPITFSRNIAEAVHQFNTLKSAVLLQIRNATSGTEMLYALDELLALFAAYSALWPSTLQNTEQVLLSKEPDPMDFLQALKVNDEKGIQTFEELKTKVNESEELMVYESMRLYLSHLKIEAWKRSLRS